MKVTEKTFLSHSGIPSSVLSSTTNTKSEPDITETSINTERSGNTASVATVPQPTVSATRTNSRVETTTGTQVSLVNQDEVLLTVREHASDDSADSSTRNSRWVVPATSPIISRFDKRGEYEGSATLRFGSSEGESIVAVESGVVTFAGSVAGEKYITIVHSDGLRSTYSTVEPSVTKGDNVIANQKIAVASGELGLTARDTQNRYLDPELFLTQ